MMGEKRAQMRISGDRLLKAGIIVLILTLMSTRGICGVWAKYVVEDSEADSARVAYMHVDGDVYSVDLSDIELPGDSEDVTIKVTGKSEVSMRYRFSAEIDGSMPLEITITDSSKTTTYLSIDPDDIDEAVQDDAMPLLVLGDIVSVAPNSDTSGSYSTYILNASWPDTENDLEYPYARSTLTIGFHAEQID